MSACAQCRAKRKKCDLKDGIFPCSRCVRNSLQCTPPPPKCVVKTSTAATTSTGAGSNELVPIQEQPPPFALTGFHPKMLDLMTTLPPNHAGLTIAVKYFASVFATHGCQKWLARLIAQTTNMGWDMPRIQSVLNAAVQNLHLDPSLEWRELPASFTRHHNKTVQESHFLHPEVASFAYLINNTLRFGGYSLFTSLFASPGRFTHIDGFVNGLITLISSCSEFNVARSVYVPSQFNSPAMYMSSLVISPDQVLFAWTVDYQIEENDPIKYTDTFVPTCLLSDNDISILQTLFD